MPDFQGITAESQIADGPLLSLTSIKAQGYNLFYIEHVRFSYETQLDSGGGFGAALLRHRRADCRVPNSNHQPPTF
jgi:hypothetical protein